MRRISRQTRVERGSGTRRLKQILSLLGHQERGALIDRINDSSETRLFLHPVDWIQVGRLREVPSALHCLDRLKRNHHLVGWFSYEMAAALEDCIPERPDYHDPLLEFGVYEDSTEPCPNTTPFSESSYQITELKTDTDKETYVRQVQEILGQIRSGNVYQVNFTVRLNFRFEGDPRDLFLSLRRSQPVGNALVFRRQGMWILSLSPELFFRIQGSEIEVRPMKGTLRRGRTIEEDEAQRERLRHSPKDRAENLMIVDLMRNDLGRIAPFGTVAVRDLYEIQKLPTLFQMISTVRAEVDRHPPLSSLLKALFPSGSVTGTPKLAAMQQIWKRESSPRGVYCGAVGRFSPEETVFSVPIRTIVLTQLEGMDAAGIYKGELGIGSGIVADSDPVKEWEESRLKSTFLVNCPPRFSLVETIRFQGGWFRLPQHLARLAASAEYFGFDYTEENVMNALRACAASLGEGIYKVRLLLKKSGETTAEAEILHPIQEPVKVALANERTDSNDPFLFHKTTHRPLYSIAQQTALEYGFWDMLFRNEKGEITEGSVSNIFARIEGTWCTPPQTSGLLAGVMREELIPKLKAEIRPLYSEDLLTAEKLLVTNSVRKVMRAELADLPRVNIRKF